MKLLNKINVDNNIKNFSIELFYQIMYNNEIILKFKNI